MSLYIIVSATQFDIALVWHALVRVLIYIALTGADEWTLTRWLKPVRRH